MRKEALEQFIQKKHDKEQALENFIQWFADSKVTHDDGEPIILYHGTTHDFSEFDTSYHWQESFIGAGFYFTNSLDDASDNYANIKGPDIKNKIENRLDELTDCDSEFYANLFDLDVEVIESMDEEELDYKIHKQVMKELGGNNDGNVMPVFLKIEKPLILDLNDGTHFDWNVEMDGNAIELQSIFEKVVKQNEDLEDIDYIDPHILYEEVKEEILVANINDVEDLLVFLEEEHHDCQSFKDENEEEFELFFQQLKEALIDHYGAETITLEIEEGFSGELYDFMEFFKEYLDEKCCLPRDETAESMIFRIHEQIGLETFCDYTINVQKLKKSIEDIEQFTYLDYKETGDMFQLADVLNQFARENNYDGIIMTPFETHFSNMKHIDDLTRHYIVFDPNQIKSAIGNTGEYSLDINDICHRLKPQIQNREKINKKDFDNIVQEFENYFNIKVEKENIKDGTVKGYTKSGIIYVNENSIENKKDLMETLHHESFHIGFRERFGNTGKVYLDKAFKLFNKNNGLEDIRKRYNLDFSKPAERLKAAEEKIAELAEKGVEIPFINNLKGFAKKNMEELEEKIENNIDFNYNDIEKVILESFKHLVQKDTNPEKTKRKKPSF